MNDQEKVIYTTRASLTGGRNGTATLSDREGRLTLAPPSPGTGQVGPDAPFNPEQLFAIGYAACFESGLRGQARRRQLPLKSAGVAAEVSLVARPAGGYRLAVAMTVTTEGLDRDIAEKLVADVHDGVCPYSAAIRGNIDVGFTVLTGNT